MIFENNNTIKKSKNRDIQVNLTLKESKNLSEY